MASVAGYSAFGRDPIGWIAFESSAWRRWQGGSGGPGHRRGCGWGGQQCGSQERCVDLGVLSDWERLVARFDSEFVLAWSRAAWMEPVGGRRNRIWGRSWTDSMVNLSLMTLRPTRAA